MDRFTEETHCRDQHDEEENLMERLPNKCEACDQRTSEELVFLPGWDILACPTCHANCTFLVTREDSEGEPLCPVEYELLLQADTVYGMTQAIQAHQGVGCVYCGLQRKTVDSVRLIEDLTVVCCDGRVA